MQFTTIFTLALASVATAAPTNEARQSYTPCCYDITTVSRHPKPKIFSTYLHPFPEATGYIIN